jgi:hypothetical protein
MAKLSSPLRSTPAPEVETTMDWTKLAGLARATMAAALTAAPAPAHADEPVPTTDQVVAIMAELTDPNRPAASKGDIVTPGFSPEEAGTIDDHLNRMNAHGLLPLNFVVTDIQPAPGNFAGATAAATGSSNQNAPPGPIVLANHGGRWQITHDTAVTALNAIWSNANRHGNAYVPGAF